MNDIVRKDQEKLTGLVKFALKVKEQRLRREEFRVNKFKIRFAKELNKTFRHLGVDVDISKIRKVNQNLKLKNRVDRGIKVGEAAPSKTLGNKNLDSFVQLKDFSINNVTKEAYT